MKKKIIVYALAGSILAGGNIYASEDTELKPVLYSNPKPVLIMVEEQSLELFINDQVLALPKDTKGAFSNKDGIVMVPLRAVAEALGYQVTWDGEKQLVEILKGAQWTTVTIGKDAYFFGRRAHMPLGKAPEIIGDRTYVPADFLIEILHQDVSLEDGAIKINQKVEPNIVYQFDQDLDGFKVGFADLPVDADESIYELGYEHRDIPVQDSESKGLYLTGHNRSDDLFIYTYKKIEQEGLKSNARYEMNLTFDLATNIPSNTMGIGGSPGDSVYVKAGIVNQEPANIKQDNYYRFNLEKGNQSTSGEDLQVIGNLTKTDDSTDDSYTYKQFETQTIVETDEEGNAYIVIGLDSGFEGKTQVYLDNIQVSYKELSE